VKDNSIHKVVLDGGNSIEKMIEAVYSDF